MLVDSRSTLWRGLFGLILTAGILTTLGAPRSPQDALAQAPPPPAPSAAKKLDEPRWCENRILGTLTAFATTKFVKEPPTDEAKTTIIHCKECDAGTTPPPPPPTPDDETGTHLLYCGQLPVRHNGVTDYEPAEKFWIPARSSSSSKYAEEIEALRGQLNELGGVEVRIATVPDPTDSGLQYYFDANIESLQLAIEREGFARDQSWLPWADTQANDDKARGLSEACRREVPGLIVFRNTKPIDAAGKEKGRYPPLVLLLVGETPTFGVQKAALAKAIDLHQRLVGGEPLRIIGPTFSGSAVSLRQTLEKEWKCHARVVSGSATSRETAEEMLTPREDHRLIQYEITTILEDELQCLFYQYLFTRAWSRPNVNGGDEQLEGVALLRESGTEFGGVTGDPDAHSIQITDPGGKTDPETSLRRQAIERRLQARKAGWFYCPYHPQLELRFPVHISSVRDSYEKGHDEHTSTAPVPIRRTTLEAALTERAKPRDIQFETSTKAPVARDLVLSHLLGAVAQENIRYVAIQATDSADVVFLARKIRDVAPDVRLVIFGNDILYTHPAFSGDLRGSFVVTPYPFFGSNAFSHQTPPKKEGDLFARFFGTKLFSSPPPKPDDVPWSHDHLPFESGMAEGVYNATLAVGRPKWAETAGLAEYDLKFLRREETIADAPPLPVWIGAIGAGGIAPVAVRRAPDCGGVVFGRTLSRSERDHCEELDQHTAETMEDLKKRRLSLYALRVEPDVTPPNFWQFLFATLMVLTAYDWIRSRGRRQVMPFFTRAERRAGLSDLEVDQSLIRAKYSFYIALRRQLLFFALVGMFVIQTLAIATYDSIAPARKFPIVLLCIGAVVTTASFITVIRAWKRYLKWHRHLRFQQRLSDQPEDDLQDDPAIPPFVQSAWRHFARRLGFDPPRTRLGVIGHSLNQLRFLGGLVALISIPLAFLFLYEIESLDPTPWSIFAIGAPTNPSVAMFVLRALPLVNRVSPAAPLLICLLCTYLWASGRSRRLCELHTLAMMTPKDAAHDARSAPITYILYGVDNEGEGRALREAEKRLADSILRPSHSPLFFLAMFGAAFFPLVAFLLKPPSTLEGWELTVVLLSLLAVCAMVIASTLVQLGLYWDSFSKLLDRVQAHPLAESFDDVPGPLKESIDSQVSQRRDDGHRFSSCVRRFEELVRTIAGVASGLPKKFAYARVDLDALATLESALVKTQNAPRGAVTTTMDAEGAKVGRNLIERARDVRSALDEVWRGGWGSPRIGKTRPADEEGAREKGERVDALTRFDGDAARADEVAWLRRAHSFVAAVITLLLNRHVRQFRIFLETSTALGLTLLLALASYAFQPRRLFLTCLWVIMLSVVAGCAYVYVQLDRNALLSRIAGTKPGRLELNASFVARVVGWMALPLLSVAAAQYPDAASKLFSFTEPFLNALK